MDFFLEEYLFLEYFRNLSENDQKEYNKLVLLLSDYGVELYGMEDLEELQKLLANIKTREVDLL